MHICDDCCGNSVLRDAHGPERPSRQKAPRGPCPDLWQCKNLEVWGFVLSSFDAVAPAPLMVSSGHSVRLVGRRIMGLKLKSRYLQSAG